MIDVVKRATLVKYILHMSTLYEIFSNLFSDTFAKKKLLYVSYNIVV